MTEIADKLAKVRRELHASQLAAARLRGSDWFAWATAGGSSVVLATSETGVAEVLITADEAWVLTDAIEHDRLQAEEIAELPIWSHPWATPEPREQFVARCAAGGRVASDRPQADELPLPSPLARARWSLTGPEQERYRRLGRAAAQAMTAALQAARPEWTELQLAGAGSEALWSRGIEPALILVAGERRLPLHRHPTPRDEPLGARAMMVFCARRHGLYACFTRHLYFRTPTPEERRAAAVVAEVEAAAFAASVPGTPLSAVLAAMTAAYARAGQPGAEAAHHQGGPCGYAAREAIARPGNSESLAEDGAVAWNPSLPGTKIEDTALLHGGALEFVTVDPAWPTVSVHGRPRPDLLVR
ncbi:Xaa-Pro aminopeptidase [Nannocystis exedens]|uniref:Xaa-Pro aminopeptidase n=1 Tax=Nannocystis exedens TaxID=54 RepID=A0A1I2HKQ8_9BACT|nr:M24 family metallopeptidase [Nannocystis exedens]PCC72002.1 peptidase M24 [Nannocystis exedens]SFF30262.1 Xaa-Pro aminopeptidase [Nannocystis exedens]